jgi:hypothetical protein
MPRRRPAMTAGTKAAACRLVRCIGGTRVCRHRGTVYGEDDAKQRAAQANEPSIKRAYEKVAEYWMLMARLESLLGDENNEDA